MMLHIALPKESPLSFLRSLSFVLVFALLGCSSPPPDPAIAKLLEAEEAREKGNTQHPRKMAPVMTPTPLFEDTDMVSLAEVDPSIVIDLAFTSTDNAFGEKYYRSNTAYLRYGFAKKICRAQKEFQKKGLRLKIWAAYRPFIAQLQMFRAVKGQGNWVSDPWRETGKKTHVRGAAIDCTLIDEEGNELEMPTPYLDFWGGAEKMKHSYTNLPKEVIENRKLLKETMIACGLEPYRGEWWHYQDSQWGKYPIIGREDEPQIHQRLLVDELLDKWAEIDRVERRNGD